MRISGRDVARATVVGIGATAAMDGVAEVLRRTRGTTSLDYALVWRWLGHMPRGVIRHQSILKAEPTPHEKACGWAAHYAIGTGFAVAFTALDPDWLDDPRFLPAVVWGLGTVAAPWLVMQPCFGMGIAASNTPNPRQARIGSLRAHAAYGAGLWVSAKIIRSCRG